MIKPITKYQNYFFTPGQNKVYGLTENKTAVEIDIINQDGEPVKLTDFFSKSGELYFIISNFVEIDNPKYGEESEPEKVIEEQFICYKQDKNGNVSELSTKPERPELHRVQLENGEFSIKNFDYKGTLCSDVNNETIIEVGPERFLLVNGFSHFPGVGLYFNIAEGRPTVRKKGLGFWDVNKKQYSYIKLPLGEIW